MPDPADLPQPDVRRWTIYVHEQAPDKPLAYRANLAYKPVEVMPVQRSCGRVLIGQGTCVRPAGHEGTCRPYEQFGQPVERPRPEDFAEQAVSLAGKKALYDHAAGVERPRDAEAVAWVRAVPVERPEKPTHICVDCGQVGHAGGYHDHGDGNAGDTCSIAELLRIAREAGEVQDERDELVQIIEAAKHVLDGGSVERPCEVTDEAYKDLTDALSQPITACAAEVGAGKCPYCRVVRAALGAVVEGER